MSEKTIINMKFWLMIVLVLALVSAPALAQNYTCIETNTSYFSTIITVSGSQIPINYNETCKFGCDDLTGRCIDAEVNLGDVGIVVGLSFLAFIFIFASTRDELSFTLNYHDFEIDPVKLLFLGLSFFMIIMEFGIIMNFAKITGQTGVYGILTGGYSGLMWAFILILFIVVIFFIYGVFKTLINVRKMRGG